MTTVEQKPPWQIAVWYSVAVLFAAVGVLAWGFCVYQLPDLVRASHSSGSAGHDEGSNNLGPGIAVAIYLGLVAVASLVALAGSVIGLRIVQHPPLFRIFRFGAITNGSLLGVAFIIALFMHLFVTPQ